MKEQLEALKRLRHGYDTGYYKQFTSSTAKLDEDYNLVLKSLTPPTSDDVCKALSEYVNSIPEIPFRKVYYDRKKKSFELGEYEPSICYLDDDGILWINWFRIPPSLIVLIGRFYQGLVK